MTSAFRERAVEVGSLRLRYLDTGQGPPLVHLQPHGEFRFTLAHDVLGRHFRVIVVEAPEAVRSAADAVAAALTTLGVERFNLLASSAAGETAVRLALLAPSRVEALVLEAPRPIRAEGAERPAGDLLPQLAQVAVPTLVLLGTRDSAAGAGRVYAERIAFSHLVFVYDAGSAIGVDRPEAFAEVVGDFLERREAFVISRADTVIHP